MLNVLQLCIFLVKLFEGCRLTAYPDPATGGAPWTIGYGETLGVTEGMVWTQEEADDRLRERLTGFLLSVLHACPQLHSEPPYRVAACVSLAYNIGTGAFSASSVRRLTAYREYLSAANAFLIWNKAAGRINRGLTSRRQRERNTYLGQKT